MPWKNKPLITYQNDDVDYYLFVDESGDHNLININNENPYFTVSGVIIEKGDYIKIEESINELKNRYWGKGLFSPKKNLYKKVCFVSRDIRKEQKAFSRYYITNIQYSSFIDDLTKLMKNIEYEIIAMSINKKSHISHNNTSINLYHIAMNFITDKFVRYLQTKDAKGLIMMEARGKKEDAQLHQHFLEIYNNGLVSLSSKTIQKTLTGGFYFNGKWNTQKDSLDTFCGLEIADLVAHPLRHYSQTNEKSRPYKAFEDKIAWHKKSD